MCVCVTNCRRSAEQTNPLPPGEFFCFILPFEAGKSLPDVVTGGVNQWLQMKNSFQLKLNYIKFDTMESDIDQKRGIQLARASLNIVFVCTYLEIRNCYMFDLQNGMSVACTEVI